MTNQVANNQVQTFNGIFGQVRIIELNDQAYFVGRDVAELLGYKNPNEAIQEHVDEEDKFLRSERGGEILKLFSTLKDLQEQLGRQDNWFISESGVYSLIFSSKLPTAKQFKHWITSEVLPAVRKHGGYLTPTSVEQALTDPDFIIRMATQLKEERQARLLAEQQVTKLKPKADYYNAYMNREETHTVTSIAQCMGIGSSELFGKLRKAGWLYKPAGQPHQIGENAPAGVFKIVKSCFTGGTRGEQLRVTNQGFKTILDTFDMPTTL